MADRLPVLSPHWIGIERPRPAPLPAQVRRHTEFVLSLKPFVRLACCNRIGKLLLANSAARLQSCHSLRQNREIILKPPVVAAPDWSIAEVKHGSAGPVHLLRVLVFSVLVFRVLACQQASETQPPPSLGPISRLPEHRPAQVHSHGKRGIIAERLGGTAVRRSPRSMNIHQMRKCRLDPRSPTVALPKRRRFLFRPAVGQQRVVGRRAQDPLKLPGRKALRPKRALGTGFLIPGNGD